MLTITTADSEDYGQARRRADWKLAVFPLGVPFSNQPSNEGYLTKERCELVRYRDDSGVLVLVHLDVEGGQVSLSKASRDVDPTTAKVRALACSDDGRRVAVGYDDGSTRIYPYDEHGSAVGIDASHPFLSGKKQTTSSNAEEDGSDSEELFGAELLTPSDGFGLGEDGDKAEVEDDEPYFAGPRVSAPIRHLAFDPRSSPKFGYLLAVSSEASPGLCVVDVSSPQSLEGVGRLLESEAGTNGGVRGVSYSVPQEKDNGTCLLAAIGMDGILSVYNLPLSDTPDVDWDLLHRDKAPCVSRKDLGQLASVVSNDELPEEVLMDRSSVPAWSPSGSILVLPGSFDVQLRVRSDVSRKFFLHSKAGRGHEDAIVATAFVPNEDGDEECLVTAGRDGRVCVWNIHVKSVMHVLNGEKERHEDASLLGSFRRLLTPLRQFFAPSTEDGAKNDPFQSLPTRLLWHTAERDVKNGKSKSNGFLCMMMTDGTISFIPKSVLTSVSEPDVDVDSLENAVENEDIRVEILDTQPPETTTRINNINVEINDLDSNEKIKRLVKKPTCQNSAVDDDEDRWMMDAARAQKGVSIGRALVDDEAHEDDDDEDDVTVDKNCEKLTISATKDKDRYLNDVAGSASDGHDSDNDLDPTEGGTMDNFQNNNHLDDTFDCPDNEKYATRVENRQSLSQQPFSPSSTPMTANSTRRILCWNHMGIVTTRVDDHSDSNIIDIAFIDAISRAGTSPITDEYNFDVGSLGEDGAIFATCSDASGSHVYFHRFETVGSLKDKDWTLLLPPGELALGCACGEGWAAVATSRNFLRLYTTGGVQGMVLALPGDPVTMVGRGRFLAVFFHESSPLPDGTQQLGYTLFDAVDGGPISTGRLSGLGKETTLDWVGFSNDYILTIMDSGGMLSMLARFGGWSWIPVLDTIGRKKSEDDSFWPISISDGKLICVPLKGGHEHPDATTARRPVTTSLDLRMPLAKGVLPKSTALEEVSLRADLTLAQKRFLNEIQLKEGAEDIDVLEEEYNIQCAQVDKVTIKLFYASLDAGKLERALDLVPRLHLEKSFDIVLTVSDQFHHSNLSKMIQGIREQKFSFQPDSGGDNTYDSPTGEECEFTVDRRQSSSRITPETSGRKNSFGRGIRTHEGVDSMDHSDDDVKTSSSNDVRSKKRQRERNHGVGSPLAREKLQNPFVKRLVQSPVKSPTKKAGEKATLGAPSPLRQPVLTRKSTFSALSRKQSKLSKHLL